MGEMTHSASLMRAPAFGGVTKDLLQSDERFPLISHASDRVRRAAN
jgi:hypothetical protein